MIITWSPIHLRNKLKDLYWKADKVAGQSSGLLGRYPALSVYSAFERPRCARPSNRQRRATRDFFGTAYGQSGHTFEGFNFGDSKVQFDDTLLLIEPGAASAYEATLLRSPILLRRCFRKFSAASLVRSSY